MKDILSSLLPIFGVALVLFFVYQYIIVSDFRFSFDGTNEVTQSLPALDLIGDKEVWQLYELPLFTASFPSRPTVTRLTGKPAEERGFTLDELYAANDGEALYIVESGELLPSEPRTAEEMLSHSRETITSMLGTEVLDSSTQPFKGNEAFFIEYKDTLNGQHVEALFVYWDGSDLGLPNRYFVVSRLSAQKITQKSFQEFTDSFEIALVSGSSGL